MERIRAIKPFYVSEPAGGDVRRYSGTIAASDTSTLSFAVSGTVQSIRVNQGDRVQKGQVLAVLDSTPFEIDIQAARSELKSAKAAFDEKKLDLDRKRQLFERGWVAKAAYDQAVAGFESAEGDLNLAQSRLSSAQHDLAKATLSAPFDGVIAERDVEPFVEVLSGQSLFALDSDRALDILLSIPDAVVGRVSVGLPVTIEVSTVSDCGCSARITEIGSTAGAANAVPVKATLIETAPGLIPGMAAEATVVLADGRDDRGYLVPLVAIAPAEGEGRGFVFRYDRQSGTIIKTQVTGRYGRDNLIEITHGVAPGDILAAAGVSFLRDGQKVRLVGE